MFIGVCRLELRLAHNNSLKGKRRVVKSIVDKTRGKFNAAIAEVGNNDSHRSAIIGASVIGNQTGHVDSMLNRIIQYIEWLAVAPIVSIQTEVIPMGSELTRRDQFLSRGDPLDEGQEDESDFTEKDVW